MSEEFEDFEDWDIPDCTDDEPARWLPAESTGVENPEAEKACDSDDEENGFRTCDCVPPRMVKWDTDPSMQTDMTPLGTDDLANNAL